jgi:alpha-D-xyloside xylohydrolase
MNSKVTTLGTYVFVFLFVLASLKSEAQDFQKTEYGIKSVINSIEVEIQFYNPSTVRVLKSTQGKSYTKKSLSVVETPHSTTLSVEQIGDELVLKSKKIQVNLNLKSGAIDFSTLHGESLLHEKELGAAFTDFDDAGTRTFSVLQSFVLDSSEAIYGLGQQQQGKMIQRNVKLKMIQGNTDDYVPFFVSVKGYGLFWDNYSPTLFEDNPDSTSFKSDVGDCIDYYVMVGGTADGVIAQMRDLTGQVPMFPLWTFGYFQSKERYKSQDELVGVVGKYRELGVPLDGIIQDWQYWGNNYLWNAMEFLNAEFYDPQKMVNDVHNLHAHMLISIWNSFGPQTKQYK